MINNDRYKLIGLMSGTSGDGLDLAFCSYEKNKQWEFEIIQAATIPFPEKLGQSLQSAHLLDAESLEFLDIAFGTWMGQVVRDFCTRNAFQPDAIASHGHTVFHRPERGMTRQIGNGQALCEASGLPVINDFRILDVVLGGQGAPLVPIGDALLFPDFDFALNLGGIANISMHTGGQRIAFDTCPFNLLLNHFSRKVGNTFDAGGNLAREGMVIPELLADLGQLPYYSLSGAKSLGREHIEADFIPLLEKGTHAIPDVLATLIEHFADNIAGVIQHQENPGTNKKQLLITGGGAYNVFFIEKLSEKIGTYANLTLPENEIIDFKEALVFGFLGVLRLRGETNCLASVTGASRDSCGGTVFGLFP
ncbi:anhydro-N-acetylmuramic acid kinase [Cyclobacterium xiamenense]|uniref:anhydro-N-acetylmuramic acid kinase n=1 Tax=Cyclobacterium xiamenense TaxID=1297121 RepID=UPI0012B7096D|nr:anhydro-N-acetylmuramic acid kinase [Cyclobacterium xiamenense]